MKNNYFNVFDEWIEKYIYKIKNSSSIQENNWLFMCFINMGNIKTGSLWSHCLNAKKSYAKVQKYLFLVTFLKTFKYLNKSN